MVRQKIPGFDHGTNVARMTLMARRFVSSGHRRVGVLLAVVHLLNSSPARAQSTAPGDTVVLIDGQRLRGSLVQILPDGTVEIATSSGVHQVPAAQVAQVLLAEPRVEGAAPVVPIEAPRRTTVHPRQDVQMSWYGYQTLVADGASVVSFVTGLALIQRTQMQPLGAGLATAGFFSYFLAAPTVHLVHGEVGRAFGDLAIRIGAPVLFGAMGLLVGAATSRPPRGQYAGLAGLVGGFATGLVGPIVIDASVLAYEKKPVVDAKLRLLPTAAITPTGLTGGLSGQF